MLKKLISLFLLCAFVLAPLSQASVQANSPDRDNEYIMCRNSKVVRTIRIDKSEKGSECVTMYTKSGVDKEVGRGTNYSTCEKVLENIRTNLEGASWKCKEVSDATFTTND